MTEYPLLTVFMYVTVSQFAECISTCELSVTVIFFVVAHNELAILYFYLRL